MSDLIIKGAEMPISCTECPCYDDMETCFCNVLDSYCEQYKTERHPDCPLVEIPTPHGRLIDADDIESITICKNKHGVLTKIEAPTVIKAEG